MMDVEPHSECSIKVQWRKNLATVQRRHFDENGKTFIPREYDIFAGFDVDKRSISVTFTDHQGLHKSLRMPYNVEHLLNHVRKHFRDKKVAFAYEAGPTGYGLYDGLVAQAYPCLIASPSMIPKAPGQRVKTNRLDSRRHLGESAWRATQNHPCSHAGVSGAAPSDPTARHLGE